MKYIFAVLMLSVLPVSAHAGAIEKLKTFIASTHSAQANFTQEVLDQNGKRIQAASGNDAVRAARKIPLDLPEAL